MLTIRSMLMATLLFCCSKVIIKQTKNKNHRLASTQLIITYMYINKSQEIIITTNNTLCDTFIFTTENTKTVWKPDYSRKQVDKPTQRETYIQHHHSYQTRLTILLLSSGLLYSQDIDWTWRTLVRWRWSSHWEQSSVEQSSIKASLKTFSFQQVFNFSDSVVVNFLKNSFNVCRVSM